MSRVQKGTTIFRPVARPQRARPGSESRQTSAVPEPRSSLAHTAKAPNGEEEMMPSAMPPPPHIPSRSAPEASPQSSEALRRKTTPAFNLSGPGNQQNGIPQPSTNSSRITVSSINAPRPVELRRQESMESMQPSQPLPSNVGVAVSTPSRYVPLVLSRSSLLDSRATFMLADERETERSQDLPHQSNPPIIANSPAVVPVSSITATGPFDMSQIDPSLQPTPTATPSYGFTAPSFVECSSMTSTIDVPSGTSVSPSQNVESHTQGSTRVTDGTSDSSQVEFKRRRAQSSQGADATTDSRPKRRRAQKIPGEESETVREGSPTEVAGRKRRAKSRAPSIPPFDPDADPGEDLDPTTVTMSSLCDDTGQGRVSSKAAQVISNHAAWRAMSREKRARLRAMAEAKKFDRTFEDEDQPPASTGEEATGPPQDDPASSRAPSAAPGNSQAGASVLGSDCPAKDGPPGDSFDYSQDLATSRYNVQVRIGANGETIVDEESLFVNRDEEEDTQNYTHVEESDTTKFVNSMTYSKKPRGSRWNAEETGLFYDALSQFGENYELISYVLPGRDRKACKNKFKAEDKKNPARINYCLNNRKPFDIETLARMTGRDFSGPPPVIKAPPTLQSAELDANVPVPEVEPAPGIPRIKDKGKTPAPTNGEEILGTIEDINEEDSLFDGDDMNVSTIC